MLLCVIFLFGYHNDLRLKIEFYFDSQRLISLRVSAVVERTRNVVAARTVVAVDRLFVEAAKVGIVDTRMATVEMIDVVLVQTAVVFVVTAAGPRILKCIGEIAKRIRSVQTSDPIFFQCMYSFK